MEIAQLILIFDPYKTLSLISSTDTVQQTPPH